MQFGDSRPAYDRIAVRYDSIYRDRVSQAEDEALLRILGPRLRAADSVLDVGCGTGWLLDRAKDLTPYDYRGFDASEEMLARLKAKHPSEANVWVGDMNAPWATSRRARHDPLSGPVGLVVSLWCSPSYGLEKHVLREAYESLKPGGRIFLMPHAVGAVADTGGGVRSDHWLPRECYAPSTGWAPWPSVSLIDMARDAGFEDVSVRCFRRNLDLPERAPLWAHRLWRRWLERGSGEGPEAALRYSFLILEGVKPW